jgi:tyrosyl-tRNA synthetase
MTPAEQAAHLLRGTETFLPEEELETRIGEGRPLRVKLGLDPTAPAVTLGWAVVLRKLRQFQDLGHTAVLIVGDFTAQVGDPSGKSETRKRLSRDEVMGYASEVLKDFGKILSQDNLEIRHNSEWLAPLDMHGILELTSKATLAQMLERDDFSNRFEAGQPISMMEFMYPLLQAYDSVAVEADVEMGGTDQLFNLMMGRQVQDRSGQRPQMVLTMPLLVGTDGTKKMSQSLGNYVGVRDDAADMFGKVMSIPDALMPQWFELASGLTYAVIDDVTARLADGSLHPNEAKRLLGRSIVTLYHDEQAGRDAEAAFDRQFREQEVPDDIAEFPLPPDDPVSIPGLLRGAGLVASGGEARRMITQGGVKLDGVPVEVESMPRAELAGRVLQVGKRRFVRLGD